MKNNIHVVQIEAETYSVFYSGIYPDNRDALFKHASSNNYWREIKNPFSNYDDKVNDISSVVSINQAIPGNVYFAGHTSKAGGYAEGLFKKIDNSTYAIYGVDKNNTFLTENNQVFSLSNN